MLFCWIQYRNRRQFSVITRMIEFGVLLLFIFIILCIPIIRGCLKNFGNRPLGPIMCHNHCHEISNCISFGFSVVHLACCLDDNLCSREETGENRYCFNANEETATSGKKLHGGHLMLKTRNNTIRDLQSIHIGGESGNKVRVEFETPGKMLICIRKTQGCYFRGLLPGYVGEKIRFETTIKIFKVGRFKNNNILVETEKNVVIFSLDKRRDTVLVYNHNLWDVSNEGSDGNVYVLTGSRTDYDKKIVWLLTWPNQLVQIVSYTRCNSLVYISKTETLYIACGKEVRYLRVSTRAKGVFFKKKDIQNIAADEERNTLFVVIGNKVMKVDFADGSKLSPIFRKRAIYEISYFNDTIYMDYCESYYFFGNTREMVGAYNLASKKIQNFAFNESGELLVGFPTYVT